MNTSGNILVLTQWSFKDALVQTYTLPYVDIIRNIISPGRKIILVTAEQQQIAINTSALNEINKNWTSRNMQLVAQPYKRFGIKKIIASIGQLWKLYWIIRKEKISIIHAFCTPAGSIGFLLSKLTGASLIIDSYEPHAESMVENGTWNKDGMAFKILFSLERKQTKRAAALIATTAGMKEYAKNKFGIEIKNYFVKPACVDLQKFSPSEKNSHLVKELGLDNKTVCVYAGKLGGIYLKEEVFEFIKVCYDYWGDRFRFLMLTNAANEEIESETKRIGLPEYVIICRYVYHSEVPNYLSLGDFAINPVKSVLTKKYCTSIKDGEYWAMGLPVIISQNISDDSDIISGEGIGVVTDLTNKENYSPALISMDLILKENNKQELQQRIYDVAKKYRSFEIAEKIYQQIYAQ